MEQGVSTLIMSFFLVSDIFCCLLHRPTLFQANNCAVFPEMHSNHLELSLQISANTSNARLTKEKIPRCRAQKKSSTVPAVSAKGAFRHGETRALGWRPTTARATAWFPWSRPSTHVANGPTRGTASTLGELFEEIVDRHGHNEGNSWVRSGTGAKAARVWVQGPRTGEELSCMFTPSSVLPTTSPGTPTLKVDIYIYI